MGSLFLEIEFYLNIFGTMHTLFGGFGIFIFFNILFCECKFCEIKITYFLPFFIAAYVALSDVKGLWKGNRRWYNILYISIKKMDLLNIIIIEETKKECG